MADKLNRIWKENRAFLVFLVLMFAFRSAVADWNEVPTGSMQPTIVEGDRILVNKLAYDIQLPFTGVSLYRHADPQSGDIIVFNSEFADKRLVKRVIGVPGDVVALKNNELTINDSAVAYSTVSTDGDSSLQLEALGEVEHFIRVQTYGSAEDSFNAVQIPEDFYLALGDNRDNSADSRVIGLIPRHEIIGRARHVVLSFDYNNYYLPRKDRFFHTL